MYRTPQDDDESAEQPTHQEEPRRRKRATSSQPSNLTPQYFGEEQLQQPKIRRASRYLDPARISPATSARLTRVEKPLYRHSSSEKDLLTETSTRLPRVDNLKTTGRITPNVAPPELPGEEPRPQTTTDAKIMVVQRKRKSVYEPPSKPRRHLKKPYMIPSRIRQNRLQALGQHRSLLLIGSGLVLLLIILPIISHLLSTQTATSIVPNSGTSIGGKTSGTGQNLPDTGHDLVIVPPNSNHPAPPVYATSAFLMDADTGQVLYAHNPFMHLPMLSTTKLMTATLAVEQGNLNQKITITNAIAHDLDQLSADSSVMGVKKGETYTLRDLLYGLMLVSGNDAAIVIADGLDGNLPTFVAKMNARAAQLGMHDTHYMNPHGLLQDNHYSSAHDLAIIGKYAFSLPIIHQISGTREYNIPQTSEHAAHDMFNGDQFLWWYPGVDAGKPGYDGIRDFVQVISCVRNNHHLIGVTMNTVDWWTDMRDLMNWGFSSFNWVSPRDYYLSNQTIPYAYDWNYFVKDQRTNTIPLGNQGRYYIYSGYSISGPMLNYFDKSGSLKKFGYPMGPATASTDTLMTQKFEHGTIQCNLTSKQCTTG
ncbi:MAG TPA: D-alanyl-D-alanine carboxypeptidase family protein [Ktedonobacteraceae bacterium]|nr:D-alanyl-D-alanine carboxypeptidase family protein [Ktedonobacteraceae bacterium]